MTRLRVAVLGVTGWTGRAVAQAIADAADLDLVAGVARSAGGRSLESIAAGAAPGPVERTLADALRRPGTIDIVVDYTSAAAVRAHVDEAVEAGCNVVVGSSGLTETDFEAIANASLRRGVGVVAAGNFSVLAHLMMQAAVLAGTVVSQREIIDYGPATKMDAPSGTARELAHRLAPTPGGPAGGGTLGQPEARGAAVAGTKVHSLRLPGYTLSTEAVFGLGSERLTIRHDPGEGPEPYVGGTLLAVRNVSGVKGLVRGLDRWLGGGATR